MNFEKKKSKLRGTLHLREREKNNTKNKKTAFENLEVNRRSYNVSSKGKGKKLSESSQIRYQTEEDISLETAGVRVLSFLTALRKVKGKCRFQILQKRPGVCELSFRVAYFTIGDCEHVISSVPAGQGESTQ